MASQDSVSQFYQDSFGNFRLAVSVNASLANTGNAVVAIPLLSGGLGNGSAIIRRITVNNPANSYPGGTSVPNMSTANVTILTSADGNTSNAVTTATGQTLGNVTAANTYQDLTLVSAASTTAYQANALFLLVTTAVANASVNICVYGDVVKF
jgi:hypothetical protein